MFFRLFIAKTQVNERFEAQRVIATVHSFRFFGLAFILPGVVGPNLSPSFAIFAAYGDLATGLLAIMALLTVRIRPVSWMFIVAFNIVGASDLIVDYYHAVRIGLPAVAGELGSIYAIPIIYVPILMITHVAAIYWLVRPDSGQRAPSPPMGQHRRLNQPRDIYDLPARNVVSGGSMRVSLSHEIQVARRYVRTIRTTGR